MAAHSHVSVRYSGLGRAHADVKKRGSLPGPNVSDDSADQRPYGGQDHQMPERVRGADGYRLPDNGERVRDPERQDHAPVLFPEPYRALPGVCVVLDENKERRGPGAQARGDHSGGKERSQDAALAGKGDAQRQLRERRHQAAPVSAHDAAGSGHGPAGVRYRGRGGGDRVLPAQRDLYLRLGAVAALAGRQDPAAGVRVLRYRQCKGHGGRQGAAGGVAGFPDRSVRAGNVGLRGPLRYSPFRTSENVQLHPGR